MRTAGIHHITAIAGEPQQNLDFYTQVLGLRFVKRTVNFDDPGSYHLYYGDETANPGSLITFFAWPGARRGSRGSGQVTAASFAVASDTMAGWKERLRENHVLAETVEERFEAEVLRFTDPDGLLLELIAAPVENNRITSFAAPTLQVNNVTLTEKLLSDTLGFEFVAEQDQRRRFRCGADPAAQVDIVRSNESFGRIAVGTVHHIAFRAASDEQQLHWREELLRLGYDVTPVIDRYYFHSIYFREPSGILFEIATDGPGFSNDESMESLGQSLKLPPMYESMRSEIERVLPPIHLPQLAK